MPTYLERADQYATPESVATTDIAGTIGKVGIDFGILANSCAFWNDKTTSVYLSLNSTTGSTGGFEIKAGENLSLTVRIGACALASTATSTGTFVRILAVRG